MNANYLAAAKKAEQLRIKLSLKSLQPINIFDVSLSLGVTVRFLDVNMEGMYFSHPNGNNPTIILSSLRPMARRVYNCAHELGHHVFGHGTKVDPLQEISPENGAYNNEERLVDTFAGLLLMPIASVQAEFAKRGWELSSSSDMQYYIIATLFGVGYQTLVTHCKINRLINEHKALELLKARPAKLLANFCDMDMNPAPFKVIDGRTGLNTIDTEVGNYLILPEDTLCEGDHLDKIHNGPFGNTFLAQQPGILRIYSTKYNFGSFVRIQKMQYSGLAENRHLENDLD